MNSPPLHLFTARRGAAPLNPPRRPHWQHQIVPAEVRAAQAMARLLGCYQDDLLDAPRRPQVAAPAGPDDGSDRPKPSRRGLRSRVRRAVHRAHLRLRIWLRRVLS